MSLTVWDGARAAIEQARTIDEVKDIRDKAEALRLYAKQAGETLEVQNGVAEIKLRAERKAGELLREMEKNEGQLLRGSTMELRDTAPTLSDLGITKQSSHRWQKTAEIPEPLFEKHIEDIKTKGEELTSAGVYRFAQELGGKAHVSYNSGENEWYTPSEYIEAARRVLGKIELDPASSALANETVRAERFYSQEDNGLEQSWCAETVWLNPPYSQPLIAEFCDALAFRYSRVDFFAACVLVNNATETAWFQTLLGEACAVCFIKGRVKFLDKNGEATGAPLQGQAVLYFGPDVAAFTEEFGVFGPVLLCQ